VEIWLDTIERNTIEQAKNLGILYGVTTNPAILAQASEPAEEILEELLNLYSGPLAVQVTLPTASDMIEQGKDLYDFSARVIVKIPVTDQGLEAIHKLSNLEIPVMATTIFEPMQALLASQAGATYVVPYFSHLGERALPLCLAISQLNLPSKLLIAALSTTEQILQCAEANFSAVTLKAPLFRECLITPPQTLEHLRRFESAWQSAPLSNLLSSPQFIR
jgi:TalC/MipB family fructose-6-phosphate aldolase